MKLLSFCLLVAMCSGCAHQFELMKANAVSMKHRDLPKGAKLVKVAEVSSRYCYDSFKSHSGKDIGLMDEVIKAAEKEHNLDFIIHPIFSIDGKCMIVEGEGVRIEQH
jgi:hypothetical protein